jgi:hypothetical protein
VFSVTYTYDQALLFLGYLPDIWYEAALFQQQTEKALSDKGDIKQSALIKEEITCNRLHFLILIANFSHV